MLDLGMVRHAATRAASPGRARSWHARVHGARAGPRRDRPRRARRRLRARVRALRVPHRAPAFAGEERWPCSPSCSLERPLPATRPRARGSRSSTRSSRACSRRTRRRPRDGGGAGGAPRGARGDRCRRRGGGASECRPASSHRGEQRLVRAAARRGAERDHAATRRARPRRRAQLREPGGASVEPLADGMLVVLLWAGGATDQAANAARAALRFRGMSAPGTPMALATGQRARCRRRASSERRPVGARSPAAGRSGDGRSGSPSTT